MQLFLNFRIFCAIVFLIACILSKSVDGRLKINKNGDVAEKKPKIIGLRLVHSDDGDICFHNNGVQIRTSTGSSKTISVQEIAGDVMYSYTTIDTDRLKEEEEKSIQRKYSHGWINGLVDVKYNCKVHPKKNQTFTGPTLIQQEDDGFVLKVLGWRIKFDKKNYPSKILFGNDFNEELEVTYVEDCLTEKLLGCDPVLDHATDHVPYTGPDEIEIKKILSNYAEFPSIPENRNLIDFKEIQSSMTRFSQWTTGTNYCGIGKVDSLPCPNEYNSEDIEADRACRQHDHGSKSEDIFGGLAIRMECAVDVNLIKATDNPLIHAVYGHYGIAQTWGCLEYTEYKCWDMSFWYPRYGYYCHSENIRYGPFRYNGVTMHWGYRNKTKECKGDLW